jgi:hypothetical protein
MKQELSTNARPHPVVILVAAFCFLIIITSSNASMAGMDKDRFYALYMPPHKITQRTIDEVVHYSSLTPVNAVVLHVKTPNGRLLWSSENALAIQLGVSTKHPRLTTYVGRLKSNNIHTIAKLDVFADNQLAATLPDFSILEKTSDLPWSDANGLHWSNPTDTRVWDYNIALAKELAHIGFDEIQFDYVRFPSDGNLSQIRYPNALPGFSKSDCIAAFLERAHAELKPLGVSLSADIFGLTAWKANDFGIGQVLEKMAPHLDVICPMFYPSHFPKGFLGKQSPGEFPEMIMETSMRSMMRRTDKPIRPWVQGFWYKPRQIGAQIDGIEKAMGSSWSIWSPTGRYGLSYKAMAQRSGTHLTRPTFYPSVNELVDKNDQFTQGHSIIVSYTNYKMGYSIISLEAPKKGKWSRYASPAAVIATLEEGIVDHILKERSIPFNPDAEPYSKRKLLNDLLCSDLGKDARRIRPEPIYIDWGRDCTFSTQDIPRSCLDCYANASQQSNGEEVAVIASNDAINIASVSETSFGVALNAAVIPPFTVFSR